MLLAKGTELYMFEGDLYKLKQKYIDVDMTDEMWLELMKDGQILLDKYKNMGEMIAYYCFQQFSTFVDFLDHKQVGVYTSHAVRKGLLEVPS